MSTVVVPIHLPGGSIGSYYAASERPAPTTRGRRYVSLSNSADSALTYSGLPDLPSTYTSGSLVCKVRVSCPTAGKVQILHRVMAKAAAENEEDDDFGAEILSASTDLVVDEKAVISTDISADVVASDSVSLILGRNTGIASDVADKVKVWAAWLEYTIP